MVKMIGRLRLFTQVYLKTRQLAVKTLCSRRISSAFSFDYEREKRTFQLQVPEYYNFCRDVIDIWADKEAAGQRGDNPGFWWIDNQGNQLKWSFQDLSEQSKKVANVLTGPVMLKPDDIVIVILPRVPQWWLINLGAIRAGIILSPGTILLRPKDILHRVKASKAKCIITDVAGADSVGKIIMEIPELKSKILVGEKSDTGPGWMNFDDLLSRSSKEFETVNSRSSDPMTVFFTSGTTGAPKMAEHSHSSYGLGHKITAKYFLDLTARDVMWNLSDTGWAKCAWSSLFAPWINGSCVFVHHSDTFDAEDTLRVMYDYPVSAFCAPPTAVRQLVLSKNFGERPFKALRHSVSGGEPVNPELLAEWKTGTGLTLFEGYGQTETTFLAGTYSSIQQKPGSMGKAAPGVDLQIVDDQGQIVPRGTEGNIGIRYRPEKPVGLFTHYVNDEERNTAAFCGDFYLTGDKAIMDEDDYIWFVARSDDVIISAGYRIGPFEIESVLMEHPAVLESAAVSSPDSVRGEIVKSFITLTEEYRNADKDALVIELQNHVKQMTAPYKYPRKIEFVSELPKTISGKIRRTELRDKEWGSSNPAESSSDSDSD